MTVNNVKKLPLAALGLVAVALIAAGCGGGESTGAYGGSGSSSSTSTTEPATVPSPEKTEAAVVSVSAAGDLGRVIVDSKGITLYDFHKDKGTTSSCYGGCAKVWPPLTSGAAPVAGEGAAASKLGTTERKDGTVQVTYAGHPLYTYTADTAPGQAKGNDIDSFGAEWYALQPSGAEAEG